MAKSTCKRMPNKPRGVADKMEVDIVVEIFRRSESLHQVKYGSYVRNGDCKTYKSILDLDPCF